MTTKLVNGKRVDMPDLEHDEWVKTLRPDVPKKDPEPDKVDILVALLKEKNLITNEDATKVKRGKP